MTLSLDDVRSKRFRMTRRSGYEVIEVDEFVDQVELSFEQLTEENQNLKKQLEALQATAPEPVTTATEPTPAPRSAGETETIVVTTGAEASTAVVRLVAMSTEQAERLVVEATDEANEIREKAAASALEVTGDAQARADLLVAEAQQTADRVRAEAQTRADTLDAEVANRRAALLDALNTERDALQQAVGELRGFETSFRANLTSELRQHISALEAGRAQPGKVPALADAAAASGTAKAAETQAASVTGNSADSVFPGDDPADNAEDTAADQGSETPRLDALLGDR